MNPKDGCDRRFASVDAVAGHEKRWVSHEERICMCDDGLGGGLKAPSVGTTFVPSRDLICVMHGLGGGLKVPSVGNTCVRCETWYV